MEAMRLMIEGIQRRSEEGVLLARVRAVSREQVRGAPRALILMTLRLRDPGPGAGIRKLKRRVRDEALRFLDVL